MEAEYERLFFRLLAGPLCLAAVILLLAWRADLWILAAHWARP